MKSFWNNKRVLITGNTGFKGSWLTLWLLKKGALVCGSSLKEDKNNYLFQNLYPSLKKNYSDTFKNIPVNINSEDELKKVVQISNPDIVFHLAAQSLVLESYKKPMETFQTNIIGTLNLLQSLDNYDKKCSVLIITTDKVYKDQNNIKGYIESDPLGGYDPYSASKAALEICVNSWRNCFCIEKESNIQISTARAGNVIGGGDWNDYRIVPDIVDAIRNKTNLELRNPRYIRPWQHVIEPLGGYIKLAELMYSNDQKGKEISEFNSAFNFGPDVNASKSVQCLVEEFSKNWEVNYFFKESQNLPHETSLLTLSNEKAKKLLNWTPKWDFEETVRKTAFWYKDYYEGIDPLYCCMRDINSYDSDI